MFGRTALASLDSPFGAAQGRLRRLSPHALTENQTSGKVRQKWGTQSCFAVHT
jgi:hypothetical protein